MRKKLWFGVLFVMVLSVAAGAHFFGRTNAQDPPKKAEPAETKGDDLFETLKKALEAKKDTKPIPPPEPLPPMKEDKGVIPPPAALPALPPPSGLPAIPPPTAVEEKLGVPPVSAKPEIASPPTLPPVTATQAVEVPKVKPMLPPLEEPKAKALPQPFAPTSPVAQPEKKNDGPPSLPPLVGTPAAPPTVQVAPNPPIGDHVAKLKDCPWSLQVDMIDGQTIVTATVNKKHEFKIVCQSVDLQTAKSILKATGKVQITGEMMTGHCDHLTIPLLDDRLLMEGGAQVSIQKIPTNVSSEKPASFELKGSELNLRISEIQSGKVIQASWQPGRDVVERVRVNDSPPTDDAKKWTPYGRLMPAKINLSEPAWSLVGNDGKVITYLVARDGGTLSQYEGRTISVLGSNEQIAGRTMLRVTHIALP